jgi:hypothetical protein
MDKQAIFDRIRQARAALKPVHPDAATVDRYVTPDTAKQYKDEAGRLFGEDPKKNETRHPQDAKKIIAKVRKAKTKSTLKKRARSIRYVSMTRLNDLLKMVDKAQRGGRWDLVERIVMHDTFLAYIQLASLMPSDYAIDWEADRGRKSKKRSLLRLPLDWRELMSTESNGQFRIPMLIALMTGCRPVELEMGVLVEQKNGGLYVTINSAKVTEHAGQEYRKFRLADHPLTDELIAVMDLGEDPLRMIVKVDCGNSVTTHMRAIGKKLWPKRKETITVYTARHGMAAECKAAIANGADPDLVSQVLGHVVDKTASYYGNRFQAGGRSVLPSEIDVPKPIRHKQRERLAERKQRGKLPSKKSHRQSASMRAGP